MAILKIKNKKYERKSFIIHIKKILHMVQRYYAAVINGYRARSRTRSNFLVAIRMIDIMNMLNIYLDKVPYGLSKEKMRKYLKNNEYLISIARDFKY